jgi:tetratricopeptide (TPR) repeat protein
MKRLVAVAFAAFFVFGSGARAAAPDEQYVGLYGLIQEADKLNAAGQTRAAVTKYLEAQVGLKNLQSASPDWNPKIVNFRIQYIASKLEPLAQKPATAVAGPVSPALPPGQELTNRLLSLQEDVSRLANQNTLLEAKLREALTVQPASSDPRELAKAEERIKLLQKERDLLAASLEQARTQSSAPAGTASDKEKQLGTQSDATHVLRKQNEDLQRQLLDAVGKLQQAGATTSSLPQVRELKEQVAMLQASNRVLQSEQIAMENKLLDWVRRYGANTTVREKQWESQLAAAYADAAAAKKERDELIQKLNAATPGLSQRSPAQPSPVPNAELEQQLAALRAKVQTFEAKSTPYTTEELAFFKQPPPKESAVETNKPMIATFAVDTNKPTFAAAAVVSKPPTEKKRDELPPGAGPLIAAAERAVDAGRYEEAERRFAEILRQDQSNVYLRSRLAASQLDQDKLAEAEANLKQALASDPEHAPSLAMLGDLRFRQEKYDEAIEALSLAAKARPDRPDTHYMLGRALVQKGNRAPAEAALRKAVQLKPGWGEPHYQLAVLYATQKPSFPELAQYHYKKAIAGGIPRNLEFEKFMEKPLTAKVP